MRGYQPAMTFDAHIARRDRDLQRGDERAVVAALEQLARPGPALELGIGTGRIALPLAARGIRVDGIDLSQAMVDQLRSDPAGAQLSITLGDFADIPVAGSYRLIYVVFNTFFNLLTQEDQTRCFGNVAAHLDADGAFVVEAYTPAFLHQLRNQQHVDAEIVEVDEVRLDVLRHFPARQMISESHVSLTQAGLHLNPVVQRYAWPSELDLMARIAGLRLWNRWGGWSQEPFDDSSSMHVSVYGR